MVEDGTIPLTNSMPSPREFLKEKFDDMMETLSDEELLELEQMEEDTDFFSVEDPNEKKVIH